MISNRELKSEIEQLTQQNQELSDELKQLKDMLQKVQDQAKQQSNHSQQGGNGQGNSQQSNQQQNNQQQNNNGQQQNNQQQNSNGQQQNSTGQSSGQQPQGAQIANIANDFLQLKGLTSQLEARMTNFISNQNGGNQLRQEDVAYLLLNVMNGMIDWTIEYTARSQGNS